MRINPLRQRMIGDMTARHIGEKTQKNYIRCVRDLAAFTGRPPETATADDLRLYRVHLVERPLGASSVNAYMSALRFIFGITLGRADLAKRLFHVYEPPRLPVVLTQVEVARLLDAAPGLFKAASEAMLTIAADKKHLGARIGMTAVLHSWGSALTHHPHVHMIVPGGGSRSMASASSLAAAASSCRSGCCRGCSGGSCWRSLPPPTARGA